jgi:phosphoribosylformylglycinamidine synthase
MGLMPHPEHAVELGFGPDLDEAMKSGQDGLIMFRTVVEMFSHA